MRSGQHLPDLPGQDEAEQGASGAKSHMRRISALGHVSQHRDDHGMKAQPKPSTAYRNKSAQA